MTFERHVRVPRRPPRKGGKAIEREAQVGQSWEQRCAEKDDRHEWRVKSIGSLLLPYVENAMSFKDYAQLLYTALQTENFHVNYIDELAT